MVAGDNDQSKMSSRGPDWFTDAYTHSPGATDLLTLFRAEHALGGIPSWEAAETTDENPERVAVLQRLTTAYLRHSLDPADTRWSKATAALAETGAALGRIDNKDRADSARLRVSSPHQTVAGTATTWTPSS